MAEIELQEEVSKKMAEAERHAQELRRREEEERKRMEEQAASERAAALEREQYMTMKEARLEAEKEVSIRYCKAARRKRRRRKPLASMTTFYPTPLPSLTMA